MHCDHPKDLVLDALNDKFWEIRASAAELALRYGLLDANAQMQNAIIDRLENDSKSQVRSAMCAAYTATDLSLDEKLQKLKQLILNDPSRMVRSNAFSSLVDLDEGSGLAIARSIQKDAGDDLLLTIAEVYSAVGEEQERLFFEDMIFNQSDKWQNEGEVRMMFYYITYTLRQDIGLRKKLPEVLKFYKKNGGSYVKMYFSRAVQYCISSLQEELSILNSESDLESIDVKTLEDLLLELGSITENE
jgi:hypothetical protein